MRTFLPLRFPILFLASLASALAAAGGRWVTIQPILTAATGSTAYVNYVSYETYANKIMEQANVELTFLAPSLLRDSSY